MKMKPAKTLPANYQEIARIDLKHDLKLALILNILGILLFFAAGWVFLKVISFVRPDGGQLWGILGGLSNLVILLIGIVFVILLHEVIHGIFFWIFTGSRPVFAFKFTYAYAAAPGWYLPRNQYLVVGLAPFLVISILAIFFFVVLPPYGVALVLVFASFNVAGAVGDLAITGWLFTKSAAVLINDRGDAAVVFAPIQAAQVDSVNIKQL